MRGKRLMLASIGLMGAVLTTTAFAAGSLHVMRMTDCSSAQGVSYTCAYPRLSGIRNNAGQQRLNVRFREMALTAKLTAEMEARKSPGTAVEGVFDYSVTRNRGGILSIRLSQTLKSAGRASAKNTGVTVSTVSGQSYRLGDLFFDNTDYVTMINERIEKQANQRGLRGFRSIRPGEEYYLTDSALVIILRHDGSPGNLAGQEFAIQLQSLEGSLKPSLRLST